MAKTATLTLKRSTTAGAVPTAGALQQAEPAINLADRKLYSKDAAGNVFQVAPSMAEYLRLTSDPRKDLVKLGVRTDGDMAYADANTAILAAAVNDIVPGVGGEVYMGPGVFAFQNIPTISNKGIRFQGCGPGVSTLKVKPAAWGHGINIVQNARGYQTQLSGFTMAASGGIAANSGIRIQYPQEASVDMRGPQVSDIYFSGEIQETDTFAACVTLQDAWLADVYGCHFRGITGGFAGDGVALVGACTDSTIRSNRFTYRDRAIYISPQAVGGGASEGANIFDNRMVGVNYGVVAGTGGNNPDMKVMYNHINAKERGVLVDNRPQIDISHNLIYRFFVEGEPSGIWYGILVQNGAPHHIVTNNKVYGFKDSGAYTANAIGISNSNGGIVSSNILVSCDTGIDLFGNSADDVFYNQFNAVTNEVISVPSGARVALSRTI